MSRPESTKAKILAALGDGKPKTLRELVQATGLGDAAITNALARAWRDGSVMRTAKPTYEPIKLFRGRAGISKTTRAFHRYLLAPRGERCLKLDDLEFVSFSKRYLDVRGGGSKSKAKLILEFLRKHSEKAWYSKHIVEALKKHGVRSVDVMSSVRRFERKGLIYVRGYRTESGQTPFVQGFLLTWINPNKPREQALTEAVERTNKVLEGEISTSPIIQRVHMIRDLVIEATKLRELTGANFLTQKLSSSENEAEQAIERALQLYPDLKEVKLFGAYRYFYHDSMDGADLKAAIKMKENYIRKVKGRANRIGHDWEACVEWFVDKFTYGARFWTQQHRSNMDPKRITLHLIKPVGRRRQAAEVDRVWEVMPGVFAKPITYVLECKWGLVHKRDLDDFFNILRWSKEFGADTQEGRMLKQGIVGIFAGGAFDQKEKVHLKNEVIELASYASRLNIQLLKEADFNAKLREHGCKLTIQKICRVAANEVQVRETLDQIWNEPAKADEVLSGLMEKNKGLYEFERMLEKN